ncbi:hypothetical protein [Streptococcus pneumoniae]|uniref:hypothetical protein n=1 Tax=Streptococcus pneumoniae TaxID=1313 RepID=UPI001E3E51A3|nr:hypothetical protein [Streptococcus pneumoniae]
MKLSDFAAILEQANLPVTYRAFKIGNAPDLPYLVYYESSPVINSADNTVNHQIKSVTVELAFESKDEDLEERLEELWANHKLFFEASDVYKRQPFKKWWSCRWYRPHQAS